MAESLRNDLTAEDLIPFAMAVHSVVNEFPVTMRSVKHKGVRIEGCEIIIKDYTGPALEKCLETNQVIREIPTEGPYRGIPVVCAPIRNQDGDPVAVLGVVDLRNAMEEMEMEED